jgi:hypothetical protein
MVYVHDTRQIAPFLVRKSQGLPERLTSVPLAPPKGIGTFVVRHFYKSSS